MNITNRKIKTNSINMHIAEIGQGFPVIFLHGFPELWYSWRYQLSTIAAAGFHAIAPDLRGFGETDAPPDIEDYSMKQRTADIIGLLDILNARECALVGHDHGANLAWACAQLYPERIASLIILSIPYRERSQEPPSTALTKFSNQFSAFQKSGAVEAELERDPKNALRRFYYALSGDAPPDLVMRLFSPKPAQVGVLDGMPDPATLPTWLTEDDLDYYAQAFSRTGFRGPLNLYRTMDIDWHELPQLGTTKVIQPTLFIGGKREAAILFGQFDPMISAVPKLRKIIFLEKCGHWVQQEYATEVNEAMIDFLKQETEVQAG